MYTGREGQAKEGEENNGIILSLNRDLLAFQHFMYMYKCMLQWNLRTRDTLRTVYKSSSFVLCREVVVC